MKFFTTAHLSASSQFAFKRSVKKLKFCISLLMFLCTHTSLFVIIINININLPSVARFLTAPLLLVFLFFRATYILATFAILVVPVNNFLNSPKKKLGRKYAQVQGSKFN